MHKNSDKSGLLIRTQNCDAKPNGTCIHCAGEGNAASKMTFTECDANTGNCENVTQNSIVFEPQSQMDIRGFLKNKLFFRFLFFTYLSIKLKNTHTHTHTHAKPKQTDKQKKT